MVEANKQAMDTMLERMNALIAGQGKAVDKPTAMVPNSNTGQAPNTANRKTRLHIPAGILRIPAFSIPVAFFSQESRFLFRRNLFRTSSGNLSVWSLRRKLHRISIC
jgi:hypothetical protein